MTANATQDTPRGTQEPLHVAVIIGSTRDGRFGPTVADWFVAQAAQRHPEFDLDVVDLAEADLPLTMTGFGQPRPPAVAGLAPRLTAADAFVVVTPEYNHSFPAALKNLIDWHHQQWQAKPVGFVSYGGVAAGTRAVQQLKQVVTTLRMLPV